VPNAEAGGKGLIFGKGLSAGKGDVNTDVQCTQSCSDVCVPVPSKVCQDVPYQTSVCKKGPVQQTKSVCNKVCTTTTTTTVSSGKGKGGFVSFGKGRHLMGGKGGLLVGILGKGKGAPTTQCNDVCKDVPYTTYTDQCQTITKTKTQCDVVYNQKCDKVCKPVCQKTTTVTTTVGKGFPIVLGKGKGL
jgi:hypothetical protein